MTSEWEKIFLFVHLYVIGIALVLNQNLVFHVRYNLHNLGLLTSALPRCETIQITNGFIPLHGANSLDFNKKYKLFFSTKSCWMSSFSPKCEHYNFISACTILSFRFLQGTLQVFLGRYVVLSNTSLLCQLISYFKRRKGECTGCSSLLEVSWSSSEDTPSCFSLRPVWNVLSSPSAAFLDLS